MQYTYETLKNILALIGAGSVLFTLAVGGIRRPIVPARSQELTARFRIGVS